MSAEGTENVFVSRPVGRFARGAGRALVVLLVAAGLAGPAGLRGAPEGPAAAKEEASGPEEAAKLAKKIEKIREEARALTLIQGVLAWYTRTQGEESIQAETYKGHEKLFSKDSVKLVGRALKRAGASPWEDDRARALDYLHTFLALSAVALETAHFDDEQANAETTTKVKLPWQDEPVAYRDLSGLLSREESAERRAQIQAKVAEVYRDVLNPILERKERRAQELVRELGFESYIQLAEKYRWVSLRKLVGLVDSYYRATDAIFHKLLEAEAMESLGMPAEKVRRSDIGRLARAPHLEKFLPKELMIPAFEEFLGGIGLDMTTAAGTMIRVDDAAHPNKEPRAACFPLRVPRDIRVTVKPAGGLDDFHTFFHEGGHALHFGWTTTDVWAFQQLGNNMTTEGWAEFFSHAWDDPAWLVRYREFVRRWNAEHPGANVPLMTDEDIRKTVRHRAFWNIYFIRRYGHAKLIYETILHGGPPEIYRDVYTGQTADLQEVYRTVFQGAYGIPLTSQDALRFRTDVDDFYYAADYTRAYGFADMMHEAMRRKFGEDWYDDPRVGALLKETFWKDGTRLQGDEALRLAGFPEGLDFDVARRRMERLLSWTGSAGTGR